jgi:dTDP-4-dehydrorhamnose reductase
MQKVLIIGGNGMLGHKLVQTLKAHFEVWTTVRSDFGRLERFGIFERETTVGGIRAENTSDLERVIGTLRPDVVVNAVGVIKQLPTSNDVINTLTINSILPHRLNELSAASAEIIQRTIVRMHTISTVGVNSSARLAAKIALPLEHL